MPNILLISSGESIAHYGNLLKRKLPFSNSLHIVNLYMEEAVEYAKHSMPEDIDVIIARGNTAKLLKTAHLSVPVVTIPITDSELVQSIEKAKNLYSEDQSQIAYIGMEDVIRSVSAFLEILHCKIRFYPITTSQDIEYSIKKAKREQIQVVIGGVYTQKLAEQYGLKCVLLGSSLSSLQEAYGRALEVQKGVQIQKKKLQERITMINSIYDGLVSIDDKKRVTLYNPSAEKYFSIPMDKVLGKNIAQLLEDPERELLNQILLSNQPVIDRLITLHNEEYLLSIHPLIVQHKNKGAILSLHPYHSITKHINKREKNTTDSSISFFHLVGTSPNFQIAVSLGIHYAKCNAPVLLIGESGSGRESFARCIHAESMRKDEIFITRSAALLLPEDLLSANNGTIYIRNIEQIQPEIIPILTDLIRNHSIQLPDKSRINLDVRLIASSAKNLSNELPEELYYLINALILPLPALRQRKQDIYPLFCSFMNSYAAEFKREYLVEYEISDVLYEYFWPGNIRQLKNLCHRLLLLPGLPKKISRQMLAKQLDDSSYYTHLNSNSSSGIRVLSQQMLSSEGNRGFVIGNKFISYEELAALNRLYQGKKKVIAENLGISRSTLWRYLKEMEQEISKETNS